MEVTGFSFSQVLEREIQEWEKAMLHVEAGALASRPWPFETILISILLEHEKALVELKSKLNAQEKQGGNNKLE